MVFLRVLDASTSVQGKKSLLLVDTYAIKLQDIPFLWNVKCILSTKMQKCDDLHVEWIWLHTDSYVDLNSDMSVNNLLAICGISSRDELCDNHTGCGNTQGRHALEAQQSFAKACAAHKTIKSFFYILLPQHW